MKNKISTAVIVGSGNMAHQLGAALKHSGIKVLEVLNRNSKSGIELAKKLQASYVYDFQQISTTADIYILAVSDDAIETVAGQLRLNDQLLVHTSGSVSLDAIKNYSLNTGVFYPLQSLSKSRKINFSTIPICIEASNDQALTQLNQLAHEFSRRVYELSSRERLTAHVAAVFASNFSNHMYSLAQQTLDEHGLDFELIRPLILETALRATEHAPDTVQTGPANRNDQKTIKKHLELLADLPESRELYRLISQNISLHNKSKKKDQ